MNLSCVGESASSFIDEGDGFTGERERVRVLQAWLPTPMRTVMLVGVHNTVDVTVERQVHMGGCVGFFRKGGCRYLQNTIGM